MIKPEPLPYHSYFAAYSAEVEPMSKPVPIEAIAAHIPPTYATDLEGCTMFTCDGWLHIRSTETSVFNLIRGWEYFAPVLRDLGCTNLLFVGKGRECANFAPHGEPFSLAGVERLGQKKIASQKVELYFGALKNSLPDETKAALGQFSACSCCAPGTITILFSDGASWPESYKAEGLFKLKPLPSVLSALPWLADADQYGFYEVRLIEAVKPGEIHHHKTFTVAELKVLRRANLARLLGGV